jgi:preprotein translocase subunit SecE
MNEQVEKSGAGPVDTTKLVVAVALVLAGVAGYYVLAAQPGWQRWLAVLGGIVAGVIVLALSSYGRDFVRFVADARNELRKVVWPNRQETMTTTAVVFGFVVIASLFFWVLDIILAWATRALTGQGG